MKEWSPKKINTLFDTYRKKIKPPQRIVIITFLDVVEDMMGVVIQKKDCVYEPHNKILTIHTSGPLKSEILLRKKEILTHMKGRLSEQHTPKEIL